MFKVNEEKHFRSEFQVQLPAQVKTKQNEQANHKKPTNQPKTQESKPEGTQE